MHDKAFWTAVAEADYAVPDGETVRGLTDELLGYLSSPDDGLRDGIAYMTMAHWAERGVWSADDVRHVVAYVVPNLMRGIGEAGDGVILRSFSALTLSLAAYADWKHSYLTAEEFDAMVAAACEYLTAERDLRGYVTGPGWLHAAAHTADVLKFLARSRHATADHLRRMLTAIAERLATPVDTVYIHSEDERLAMAVLDIAKRGMLTRDDFAAFVQRMMAVIEHSESGNFDVTIHATYMNVKHFLRALYFRLSFAEPKIEGAHDLAQQAFDALKKFRM